MTIKYAPDSRWLIQKSLFEKIIIEFKKGRWDGGNVVLFFFKSKVGHKFRERMTPTAPPRTPIPKNTSPKFATDSHPRRSLSIPWICLCLQRWAFSEAFPKAGSLSSRLLSVARDRTLPELDSGKALLEDDPAAVGGGHQAQTRWG